MGPLVEIDKKEGRKRICTIEIVENFTRRIF